MPLLQESTPKRDMLTKVDSEEKSPLTSVPYPSLFTPSQLLMASQLMAASRLTLPTSPAFFHPGLLPLAWPPNSPPSPSTTPDPLTSPLKSRKLNNNNVVSSSSEPLLSQNKGTIKRKSWKNQDEDTPSPTSSVSPPSSTEVKDVSRDRPFTCQVCNRSFGYKHVLQNHERTHTGEKPFECPECHKKFTRDHHLKTHMRLHTGERPYRCDHCDRQFVQVANLRRHLRVHTGERPYACDHCTAKFSDSNQLKAHILIHTNEKPFECERCHFRFRRRHHLLHHKCGSLEEESTPDSEAEDEPRRRRLHPPGAPIVTLPLRVSLPEQTEPEDLSMNSHSHEHHEHLQSSGESPMSRSPSSREELDEDDFDPHETALFLKGLHS